MISVIVPVYNCPDYLENCIHSIMAQTYEDIECIIVDDGSTDGITPQICDDLKNKDDRVKVIHKQNEGHQLARKAGLDMCRGAYVMFVDADDYIEPNVLRRCLDAMKETDTDMVCFDYCVNEEGEPGFQIKDVEIVNSEAALKYMLSLQRMDGNLWCKLYKKELLKNVVFDSRRNCDFVTMAMIIQHASGIALIPLCGYHYRIVEDSLSRNIMCHPKEEEYEQTAYAFLKKIEKEYPGIREEAKYYWLNTLLYVCIKMEKDITVQRHSERFRVIKKKTRRGLMFYLRSPYSTFGDKLKYFMCCFNIFRPFYRCYSFIMKNKKRGIL